MTKVFLILELITLLVLVIVEWDHIGARLGRMWRILTGRGKDA